MAGKSSTRRRGAPKAESARAGRGAAALSDALAALRAETKRLREELAAEQSYSQADMSEWRDVERSRDRYADLYDRSPVGYASIDRSGCIREINLAGTRLLGQERHDLRGRPLLPLVAKGDRRKWLGHLGRFRKGKATQAEIEVRIPRKTAPPVVLRLFSIREMAEAGEEPPGLVLRTAMLDVTAQRRAEDELRELNETLERRVAERTAEVQDKSEQLRALASQLAQAEQQERKHLATILHDHIQQLLVAARLQMEWLTAAVRGERQKSAASAVDSILHEALVASRKLTVDLSPPVLREAGLVGGLSWLATRMGEEGRLAVRFRADGRAEPPDEETRFLLFQGARELLFNAVKHAGVKEAELTLARAGDGKVRLVVADEGKGFDPDVLRRRRADEMTFGLFSIRERLAHVGGTMDVESAPGHGTRITLTVPAAPAEEAKREAAAAAAAESRRRGAIRLRRKGEIGVLIVDDHKIMREGLSGLLAFEQGIEVVGEAGDGPAAVELAAKLAPDVVVMDVNLPDMGGVEATRRIVAARPKTKVIGLSMHVDREVAMAMREAGAAAYLTKGGPARDLIDAIRACAAAGGKK